MEITIRNHGQPSGRDWRPVPNPGGRPGPTVHGSRFLRRRYRVAESAGEEYEHGAGGAPRLLNLLAGAGKTAAFRTPLGVDEQGRTAWLDLCLEDSRHVLVEGGPASARSEMVRSLAVGLAMTSRPALLQLLAVDFSGRELLVLESLPHAVIDTATEPTTCTESLLWLTAELKARRNEGRRWPEMLLVIDDLMSLAASPCGRARSALTEVLRLGGGSGMHVLAGGPSLTSGLRRAGWSSPDVARVVADDRPGAYVFHRRGFSCRIAGSRVPAVDLDRVSCGLRWGKEGKPEGEGIDALSGRPSTGDAGDLS